MMTFMERVLVRGLQVLALACVCPSPGTRDETGGGEKAWKRSRAGAEQEGWKVPNWNMAANRKTDKPGKSER